MNIKNCVILFFIYLFSLKAYSAPMTIPQAGSFYPIYNKNVPQYIKPSEKMPFDKISTLYLAFAHAYYQGETQAVNLEYEKGQPDQEMRIRSIVNVARKVNPNIDIFISLGWGKEDWKRIALDLTSGENQFPKSIVKFLRVNNLDGFDIDDEEKVLSEITQDQFDVVIKNIKTELDKASYIDRRNYHLTITPAFDLQHVSKNNFKYFDMINLQNGNDEQLFIDAGIPRHKLTLGIDSETAQCHPTYRDPTGFAGMFNWNMSIDSICGDFDNTHIIAKMVGYSKD